MVLLAAGCGRVSKDDAPEAVADLVCQLRSDCDCLDQSACQSRVEDAVSTMIVDAEDAGLEYDAKCMGELLTHVEEQGCHWAVEGGGKDSCLCRPFYGEQIEGGQCQNIQTVDIPGLDIQIDTCDAETLCWPPHLPSGTCVPRCWVHTGKPKGESCVTPPFLDCAEGLACTQDVCRPGPAVGEPCEDRGCEKGAFCDDDFVCAQLRSQGEPCDDFRQCASDYCPNGTCQPLPGFGDECFGGCQQGLACDGGTCVAQVCL